MTYTAESPILSQGQASAASIDAWFAAHGTDPGGLGNAILAFSAPYGLNGDLVAAQIASGNVVRMSASKTVTGIA